MARTVLIVDDNPLFRGQIKRLLEGELRVSVVEAGDGEEALQLAQHLQPDLVLMDIAMPRMDGLEATRRLKGTHPTTKIIILTAHGEEPYRKAALGSGADLFLLKTMAELVRTIGSFIPPSE